MFKHESDHIREIALKPTNLSCEQAAAVPLAALTARQDLRDNGNTNHQVSTTCFYAWYSRQARLASTP